MHVGMDYSPPFTMLEGYYNKDNAFVVEDDNSGDLNNLKRTAKGKPPRHVSIMRHSISSTRLLTSGELVSCYSSSPTRSSCILIFLV